MRSSLSGLVLGICSPISQISTVCLEYSKTCHMSDEWACDYHRDLYLSPCLTKGDSLDHKSYTESEGEVNDMHLLLVIVLTFH